MRTTPHKCSVKQLFSRTTLTSAAILISLVQSAFAGAPVGPSGCPTKTTAFENTTAQAINDYSTTTSTITVSGLDPYLWDVDLTTHMTHTACGDLDITLTSPKGTVVTITARNGGSYRNLFDGTLWDDDAGDTNAPGPVTDNAFDDDVTETPLCPEEAFGAFIGENPNGVWTLEVYDNMMGCTGSLNGWSLDITTLPARPYTLGGSRQVFFNSSIPDGGTRTLNIGVSGIGTFVSEVVVIMAIEHTRCQDLDITLTSPAGTTVTLTTDNGGNNSNVFNNTLWQDDASSEPGPVTLTSFTDGVAPTSLCPEEAFAAFIGEDPTGNWTLTITDDQTGETGLLKNWIISIETGSYRDFDSDGVINVLDICNGFDDNADGDGDGVPDGCDLCSGFDDADDADGDGQPDQCDQCPDDSDKVTPGACGCGVADTDTDADGVPDCWDGCPNDASKSAPGTCGCGVAEEDLDGDGVPDCLAIDLCPDDPDKTLPGICGCGVADTDTDGDGIPDCLEPGGQENPQSSDGNWLFWPFPFCGLGTAACLPLMVAGLGLMRNRVRRRRRN